MSYQNTSTLIPTGEAMTTLINTPEAKSHPQFSQVHEDLWALKQALERDHYDSPEGYAAKTIDPFVKQAVKDMTIASFIGTKLAYGGSNDPTSTDLGFSLRNFLAASPVDDPNALFGRLAEREGRAQASYILPLSQPRRTPEVKDTEMEVGQEEQGPSEFTYLPTTASMGF